MTDRATSYGQTNHLTWVDRLGVRLSARRIRRHVPDFRGKRVADVGCGYQALFFREIAAEVAEAWLLDVAVAPELRKLDNVHVLEGDLLTGIRSISASSLDVVLCNSVLEHLWQPRETLAEFFRVLAPGGVCLINVPTWLGKTALEFSAFRLGLSPRSEMDDHKMYYDKRDLWPMLVEAGFRPSAIELRYHKFRLNLFAACRK